jgi:hypothetical protein
MKLILTSITALSFLIFFASPVTASDIESRPTYTPNIVSCKPYKEEDLIGIKASNRPGLIAGAGLVELVISPTSTVGLDLLSLASEKESPKGLATTALIMNQLNNYLPLSSLKKKIERLIQDDKENALPYYANALLLMEDGKMQESLAQIKMGNTKKFNGYSKQRFHEIVNAGVQPGAGCLKIEIQRNALLQSFNTVLFIKSRKLCEKLAESREPQAMPVCTAMGQNLEKSSITFIDQLNSLAIQRIAAKDMQDNETKLNEIKNRRDKVMNCPARGQVWLEAEDVTEEADLKYDELFLDFGECSALEFLADYAKQINKKP